MRDDGTVRLWHVATGRELLKFQLPVGDVILIRLGYSQDGRTLGAFWLDEHGQMTRLWFAPSFAEIAVAEGRDYRAQMGGDPAIWLATGRALARRNRDTEALEVFTKVIQFSSKQPGLEPLQTSALKQRGELLERLGRVAEAGTDNCEALNIPTRDPRAPAPLIDLSPWLNRPLDSEDPTIPPMTNYLEGLPRGLHALPGTGAIRFDLRGVVKLSACDGYWLDPRSAEGIPVQQKCLRVHFLQSAHNQVAEGVIVGAYVIRYADGQREDVPIRYGRHMRSLLLSKDPGELPDGKVAWTGTHPTEGAIRVFEQTWENPRPQVEIATLDFVSKLTECAPFLIAITAEPPN